MNVKEALGAFAPQINALISELLAEEEAYAIKLNPIFKELFQHIRTVSAGGKRLRAALVYYSYLLHGRSSDNKVILRLAAIIELIHTYILIEDDIMDQDDVRRGVTNLHRIYEDKHIKDKLLTDNARHFGESIALSSALIISHFTQRLLAQLDIPPATFKQLHLYAQRNLIDTGYGQVLDIYAEALPEVTEEQVEQILYLKTACYTYQNPLEMGAIMAGATPEQFAKLKAYAIPAGIAFQIQDDILGMFGDEEKTGKPADSDLKEGKRNLLTVKAIEFAKPEQSKRFREILGNKKVTPAMLAEARQIIIDSGALEYSRKRAQQLVAEALKALDDNPQWKGEGRAFLASIAEYMINRDV